MESQKKEKELTYSFFFLRSPPKHPLRGPGPGFRQFFDPEKKPHLPLALGLAPSFSPPANVPLPLRGAGQGRPKPGEKQNRPVFESLLFPIPLSLPLVSLDFCSHKGQLPSFFFFFFVFCRCFLFCSLFFLENPLLPPSFVPLPPRRVPLPGRGECFRGNPGPPPCPGLEFLTPAVSFSPGIYPWQNLTNLPRRTWGSNNTEICSTRPDTIGAPVGPANTGCSPFAPEPGWAAYPAQRPPIDCGALGSGAWNLAAPSQVFFCPRAPMAKLVLSLFPYHCPAGPGHGFFSKGAIVSRTWRPEQTLPNGPVLLNSGPWPSGLSLPPESFQRCVPPCLGAGSPPPQRRAPVVSPPVLPEMNRCRGRPLGLGLRGRVVGFRLLWSPFGCSAGRIKGRGGGALRGPCSWILESIRVSRKTRAWPVNMASPEKETSPLPLVGAARFPRWEKKSAPVCRSAPRPSRLPGNLKKTGWGRRP